MTPRKTLLLAASISAIAFAAPAHAISLNVGAGAEGNIGIGIGSESSGVEIGIGVDIDAEADVSAEGEASADGEANTNDVFAEADATTRVDLVIGLIADSVWTAETELRDATTFAAAEAYSVGLWLTTETQSRFEAAVAENMESIANLRAAIQANASLSAWLESENIDVNTVVALGVTAEGELVAFTE